MLSRHISSTLVLSIELSEKKYSEHPVYLSYPKPQHGREIEILVKVYPWVAVELPHESSPLSYSPAAKT